MTASSLWVDRGGRASVVTQIGNNERVVRYLENAMPFRRFVETFAVLWVGSVSGPIAPVGGDEPETLALSVVDDQGRPVPGVEFGVGQRPPIEPADVRVGRFVETRQYDSLLGTDDAGRAEFVVEDRQKPLTITIRADGWAGYRARFEPRSPTGAVPESFTVRLSPAWSVGGVICDRRGRPVGGAVVAPFIELKKPPEDTSQMMTGDRIVTGDDGIWRFDRVPRGLDSMEVEISHPTLASFIGGLPRARYGLRRDQVPTEPVVLADGVTIRGRVTDDAGEPIAGALVRTKFRNRVRSVESDADGRYEIPGGMPGMTRVVASAEGRALDLQTVRVDAEMDPVDFTMVPGGRIEVQVLDADGRGIPGARIFFQRWRGRIGYFEFDHLPDTTDEDGWWRWDEAPADEILADIIHPGGGQMQQRRLIAGDVPHVFMPPPRLVIRGRVVDLQTGEPVDRFRVIKGIRSVMPDERLHWLHNEAFESVDGRYEVSFDRADPSAVVRIEAAGYRPAQTRDVAFDEGEVVEDLRLEPAASIDWVVVDADGRPAAGADVAVGMPGEQISITRGRFDRQTYARQMTTDADGRLRLPRPAGASRVVVLHDAGYASVPTRGPAPAGDEVRLTPWARIEGVFRVGDRPGGGVRLNLSTQALHSYGPDVPKIFVHHELTTDADGSFRVDRGFDGPASIGRDILFMVDDGAMEVTSSARVPIELTAGKTLSLELGGDGRAVVGRLKVPPGRDGQPLWNFVKLRMAAAGEPVGESPRYLATIDRDGSFRIDDVGPGAYRVWADGDERFPIELPRRRVEVPSVTPDDNDAPFDLGELPTREKRR